MLSHKAVSGSTLRAAASRLRESFARGAANERRCLTAFKDTLARSLRLSSPAWQTDEGYTAMRNAILKRNCRGAVDAAAGLNDHTSVAKQRQRKQKITPASRPLQQATPAQLAQQFERALAHSDGLAGAHCVHEWWMRGGFPTLIEQSLQRLWAQAAATVPEWLPMRYVDWLPQVYETCAFFAAAKGRSNIYLVLLDYSDRGGDPYGVYVGMTAYTPAQRFDQHKAGLRAAGSVLKRGLEVLTGPVLHLQLIQRADAARIEVELAEALSAAGLYVKGGH